MNVEEFTYLLQNPEQVISAVQTRELEDILTEYPYFQAARAIHLKGLKNLNSFKYNDALKVTAACTTDRDLLFEFITSEEFLQNSVADSLNKLPTDEEKENQKQIIVNSEDAPLPQNLKDADHILDPELFKAKEPIKKENTSAQNEAEKTLEMGAPLSFTKDEKYSFSEWLQLTSTQKIEREDDNSTNKIEKSSLKKKKFDLIDKFIAENPKIVPTQSSSKIDIKKSLKIDKNELMTATLAKVYVEQKKYKKAIQAYKILSLKYPKKSGFFADQIKAVEKVQQDNS